MIIYLSAPEPELAIKSSESLFLFGLSALFGFESKIPDYKFIK